MSLDTLLLFLAVSILPAISPGPGVLLAISNALRFGAKAALVSGLGNAVGLAVKHRQIFHSILSLQYRHI